MDGSKDSENDGQMDRHIRLNHCLDLGRVNVMLISYFKSPLLEKRGYQKIGGFLFINGIFLCWNFLILTSWESSANVAAALWQGFLILYALHLDHIFMTLSDRAVIFVYKKNEQLV